MFIMKVVGLYVNKEKATHVMKSVLSQRPLSYHGYSRNFAV